MSQALELPLKLFDIGVLAFHVSDPPSLSYETSLPGA